MNDSVIKEPLLAVDGQYDADEINKESGTHIIGAAETFVIKNTVTNYFICSLSHDSDGNRTLISTDNQYNAKIFFSKTAVKTYFSDLKKAGVTDYKITRFATHADSQ